MRVNVSMKYICESPFWTLTFPKRRFERGEIITRDEWLELPYEEKILFREIDPGEKNIFSDDFNFDF